tara:strand:- start:210 stop:350 length:141 start_codon:yes stop_codon:yes gene_type:complete
MNGNLITIQTMSCKCGISVKYNVESSVSFVDAHRALTEKCVCEGLE